MEGTTTVPLSLRLRSLAARGMATPPPRPHALAQSPESSASETYAEWQNQSRRLVQTTLSQVFVAYLVAERSASTRGAASLGNLGEESRRRFAEAASRLLDHLDQARRGDHGPTSRWERYSHRDHLALLEGLCGMLATLIQAVYEDDYARASRTIAALSYESLKLGVIPESALAGIVRPSSPPAPPDAAEHARQRPGRVFL
ncbi:MAG: hypothetical protein HYX52_04170 [Chloroflexi bacterium]|nr:hypothetical protein [Chloroflexota bacterium]